MRAPTVRALIITGIAILAIGACSSTKVEYHSDPSADFSAYRLYSWIEPSEEDAAKYTPPKHLDRRFRRVVDDAMAEKGFERSPVEPAADLLMVYYVAVNSELRVTSVPYGYWGVHQYGYWPGYGYGATEVRKYNEGTVLLDIIDAKTHQMVWTGTVTKAVHSSNPSSDKIAKTVKQLLKGFPPPR